MACSILSYGKLKNARGLRQRLYAPNSSSEAQKARTICGNASPPSHFLASRRPDGELIRETRMCAAMFTEGLEPRICRFSRSREDWANNVSVLRHPQPGIQQMPQAIPTCHVKETQEQSMVVYLLFEGPYHACTFFEYKF